MTTYCPASTALNSCYNGLDQVRYKQSSDTTPPVTYTYNKSWLAQVQSSASTYSYVFDPLGRVKGGTQTTPTGGQSYTFGANLKPTVGILSITYPNSGRVVTTGYDSGGRPTTHLCVMDSSSHEAKTVCGIILTEHHSWKPIRALEGDECPRCAERAFNGHRQHVPEDLRAKAIIDR